MNKHYSRLYRQFRALSDQLNEMMVNGKWDNLSTNIKKQLTEKLRRKFQKLNGIFTGKSLVKALGAAAFLLGFNSAIGQTSFAPPVNNPFGLDSLADLNVPTMVDIDADGDLDIFAGDYFGNLNFFENTGSATSPAFSGPDTAAFGLPEFDIFLYADFADFDDDGDYDLIGASDTGATPAFIYVENMGSASAPAFGSITLNPFGIDVSNSGDYLLPTVADLDGDGDFDILAATDAGQKIFYENTGTPSAPAFGSGVINPFSLVNNPSNYEAPLAVADVDKDGDMDVVECEYYQGDFIFYENTGSSTMPSFGSPQTNPFSLTGTGTQDFSVPALGDLDGDGDMDIMVGDYYGAFTYYENTTPVGISERTAQSDVKVFPSITEGEVQIVLPSAGLYTFRILNQNGQLMSESTLQSSNTHTRILPSSSGLYYLQFIDSEGTMSTLKVIKK